LKSLLSNIKRRFYQRFTHRLDTPRDLRLSRFFAEWIDVGFLRHRWTNEGEIAPGVIRANNPDEARWDKYANRGIKTALNLRNDTTRSPFLFAKQASENRGITFVSAPMLPRQAPTRENLLGLINLFPTLEKPILMHCKSGADRTGLAAAIWRMTQEGESLADARSELSLRYIHRRDSDTGVLDEVLDAYEPFEAKMDFRTWVETEYDPTAAQQKFEANRPKRGVFGTIRHFYKDVYTYAQHREAVWHDSFAKPVVTEADAKRARFFMTWIDHGILRGVWRNFHRIGDGVFRSNHPTEARFRTYAADGFKTVINLRGASMQPQYQLEKRICADLNLALIDIEMSGGRAPTKDNIQALLSAYETAERPMILHCKSGADRTGFAAALYQVTQGVPFEIAQKQLSLRYLHLRGGSKGILGWVLQQYQAETAKSGQSFAEWAKESYDPESLTAGFKAFRGNGQFPAPTTPLSRGRPCKKIAAVTRYCGAAGSLDQWFDHYGKEFGYSSLFVIVDGFEHKVAKRDGVTYISVPAGFLDARKISNLIEVLLRSFDMVTGVKITDRLAPDTTGQALAEHLSEISDQSMLSRLNAATKSGGVSGVAKNIVGSGT